MTEVEPVKCPTCESDDISYVDRFEDGGMRVVCQVADCMSEWWEVWNFSHIEMIEGEDNRRSHKRALEYVLGRRMNENMKELKEEITKALNEEKGYELDDHLIGWIEALEYVLGRIKVHMEEEE